METQHQRILKLHENREWVCQAEYRNISWCPHKRRADIEQGRAKGIPEGRYKFESKDCEHGIKGSKDYLLVRNPYLVSYTSPEMIKKLELFVEQTEKLNL